MQRLFTLLLVAVVVVSCEYERQQPTAPATGSPKAFISDGSDPASGGNPHFYWLPELVNAPSPTGVFNGDLPAEIRLCDLEDRGSDNTGRDAVCAPGSERVLFGPSQVSVDPVAEHYSAVWKTSDSNLSNAVDYRLSVFVGATELGFRDLDPEENPPSPIDKAAPFYAFKNGNTINIKFRIEEGALCDPDSESCGECLLRLDGTGGNNPEFFPNGDESACNADEGVGVLIPEAALTQPTLVIVERVECPVEDGVSDGRVDFFQSLDIPQYGGCFTVRTDPPLNIQDPDNYAIAGACVDANSLSAEQEANLKLHKTADASDSDGVVEVLNNVAAPFVDCEAFALNVRDADSPALLRLAGRAWRDLSPFAAPSLYARHLGVGGETPTFSDFVWALPSQQEAVSPLSQVAPVSSEVTPPAVKVTDEDGLPVKGARVTFSLTQSPGMGGDIDPDSPAEVETDADGIAELARWKLGSDPGDNIVTSGGYGIAVKGEQWTANLGREGTGPFVHSSLTNWDGFDDVTVEGFRLPLKLNPSGNDFNLEFTATGCVQGEGTADVTDGTKDASWDCANTEPFTANIGGGKKDATFYWMRQGSTFYFAIQIPVDETSSESVNIWTLYLNDSGSSTLIGGDDVLVLDGATQAFSDQHWAEGKCPKGQSFCASLDDEGKRNGEGHFAINQNSNGGTFYFYELTHELKGDAYQDVADTGTLAATFTLRVGNGNKGNTEWPGPFGVYWQIIP